MELIAEIFSYPFMVRALIAGCLISLCAALLGVSLVLKRYSMIGDGLSHVGFGALALATVLNAAPLAVAIPVVVIAAFFLLRIRSGSKIRGDAAIGLISAGSMAIGIMMISMTSGVNTDVYNYMFGSILAVNRENVVMCVILSAVVFLLFVGCYHRMFAVTFDETFARATGMRVEFYNGLLAALTALTIVLGMRLMGSLLISSLIVFPALTAMRVCKRFLSVIISAAVISVVCFFLGLVMSYAWSTPTGAGVVVVNLVVFLLFSVIGKVRER